MKENYVKKIGKLLTCGKKRREEIKKELSTDIDAAVAAGEKEEEIIARMGKAEEIAKSFNQSFSEDELKIFRKERRIRRLIDILAVIVVMAVLFWWMIPKNTWLKDSKRFDETAVQKQAEEVVKLLDAGDYAGLRAMADSKMAGLINEEEMETARDNLTEDWGGFQNYGSVYLIESTQRGIHSAVVQMTAAYENTSVTYTISFDEDLKLTGLYMK